MGEQIVRNFVADQVYNSIKEKIIHNEYKPGEKLNVNEIAGRLNVSRSPVMSALARLGQEGFVTVVPQSGTYVKEVSTSELQLLYRCRAAVEQTVVENCGPLYDRGELGRFRDCFLELGERLKANGSRQWEELFQLDLSFHAYLMSVCPGILEQHVQNLSELTQRTRRLFFSGTFTRSYESYGIYLDFGVREHCRIIDYLTAGEYHQAGEAVYQDIVRGFERMLSETET